MTPERLRQMAAELEGKAEEALRAGKDAEADGFVRAAWKARDLAEQRERELAGRHKGDQSGTLKPMLPAARVRIAKGVTRDKKPDEFQLVASAAGHTMRSIAEKLGCSNVFLLKTRRGEKAIRESWAKAVQEMTRSKDYPGGFAATRRNWPGGWAREPSE